MSRNNHNRDQNNSIDLPSTEYTEEYYQLTINQYLENQPWMRKRIKDILSLLHPSPGEHILDVGCGIGTISLECGKRGASVIAVDYCDTAVRMARELELAVLGKNEIDYRCLDIKDISTISKKFDKVISADFVEHISKTLFEIFLSEVKLLMKERSSLVIYTPNGFVQPSVLQKIVRLVGLLPCLRNSNLKEMKKRNCSQRHYPLNPLEAFPDDEKYNYLHVDVKTASYLYETLNKSGFKVYTLRVSRSSSRLEALPYPYNVLWGGHLCIAAGMA